MNDWKKFRRFATAGVMLTGLSLLLMGCPGGLSEAQIQYDLGYVAGFAQDDEYWQGFDDSLDTVDGGAIYYSGSEIPFLDELSYDAGFYDGTWYAYNDGYFVAYDYAFTIGFSEGYDAAFASDWFVFLSNDEHVEWLDGGFTDGYNDGFSEGRILGATDYAQGLPFDWLDAMLYYREPNDVYIEELDLGTGEFGPVFLYEYGTDPLDLVKSRNAIDKSLRNRRSGLQKQDSSGVVVRALRASDIDYYTYLPAESPRAPGRALLLDTTWLERIEAYEASFGKGAESLRQRAVTLNTAR
ncbi:MAG: hypothetical protein HYV27_22890 [Candidatus Hydrogenedentes bacterium]|nr:hypothetical protein [Candidatus Hydrogenedentota bacterium]